MFIRRILISSLPIVLFLQGATAEARLAAGAIPHVLSRAQWGADESLRFRSQQSSTSSVTVQEDNGSVTISERQKECALAHLNYPEEFRVRNTQREDSDGQRYLWPLSYSRSVKLLVVHHTAITIDGDNRSAAERVRALYKYHASNLGWGDIGYHYIVDEDGVIYEGRAGGEGVVGGHAYCSNVGTIGIALLGNFDVEEPTQTQLKSLQWLLKDLADTYDIDVSKKTLYHGKLMDPIVGHGDLLSTDCPGFYLHGALTQIRAHVASGDVFASVRLPTRATRTSRIAAVRESRLSQAKAAQPRGVQRLLNSQASRLLLRKLRSGAAVPESPVSSSSSESRSYSRESTRVSAKVGPLIRFRLSYDKNYADVAFSGETTTRLMQDGRSCVRTQKGQELSRGIVRIEGGESEWTIASWDRASNRFRGTLECRVVNGQLVLINELPLEQYLYGLAEEPDTEPYEKQRAFAIAARTYAAYYLDANHRKFSGMPYDGSDNPAEFQKYGGVAFEERNPQWVRAVTATDSLVLKVGEAIIKPPYFSADDGRTRSPGEVGWENFPFAEIFSSKADPWCSGETLRGHGVGMSGCGAEGQANEGKTAEAILQYYYPGTSLKRL